MNWCCQLIGPEIPPLLRIVLTRVSEGHNNRVLEHVVIELIVGGQGGDSTPRHRERHKYLSCCFSPDLLVIDNIIVLIVYALGLN